MKTKDHGRPNCTDTSRYGEEQDHLEDPAPLRGPLLEVTEQDIADREDGRDESDFKPGIHVSSPRPYRVQRTMRHLARDLVV